MQSLFRLWRRVRSESSTCTQVLMWLVVTGLAVIVFPALAAGAEGGASRSNDTRVQRLSTESASVTTSREVEGTADFQVGYTYTQASHLAQGGELSAVNSAKHLLASLGAFQNVSLMGWGTQDPEPSPGLYHWGTLDGRVDVMEETAPPDRRMITLCTAPGWMKVGGTSQEWNMDAAVAPSHYADFAQLAAQVAERYDGHHRARDGRLLPKVDYFDVWNEMKGFWDTATNSWNAQAYTTLYNDVYAAIKEVRPDARIGGPYAPLDAGNPQTITDPSSVQGSFGVIDQRALDVVTYWLAHKTGAQFMSVDGGPASTSANGFVSGRYFTAVSDWLRSLDGTADRRARGLPILWAEFYPGIDSRSGVASGQEAVAVDVSNILQAGQAGVNDLLIWEMEGSAAGRSPSTGEGVWTDTAEADGGRPTAFYRALLKLARTFPPHTNLYRTTVEGPVTALAGPKGVLLVSESSHALSVSVNGNRLTLGPYAVTVTH